MTKPLISIIVPCYNQAEYLDECLQSVLDQTYKNWECIIVNDGSPDNTEEVAKRWVEKHSRFKYIYKDNSGVSATRNLGIENALGKWILPLDGDDKIHKDYLFKACKFFSDDVDIIYCHADYFGELGGSFNLPEFNFREFLICNQIFCSGFYRRDDWKNIGGYDIKFVYGYEDWDFWISLLKNSKNKKVIRLDFVGFYYRRMKNGRDTSFINNKTKRDVIFNLLYSKHKELYDELFGNYIELLQDKQSVEKSLDELKNKTKFFRAIKRLFK